MRTAVTSSRLPAARLAARVAGTALAFALLSACGGDASGSAGAAPEVPAALTESPEELPTNPDDTPLMAATETGTPTLPPGDPGLGSTAPPRAEDDEEHEHPPRTDVPAVAMLDAATLSAVLGETWKPVEAPPDSCSTPKPAGSLVTRTSALASTRGRLIETVAVHADHEAAEQVPATMTRRLKACGWTFEEAPLIGEAAAQLRRRTSAGVERIVVVGVEGVSVTLVATGPSLAPADRLAAVVDIASSTSCGAAADGCH